MAEPPPRWWLHLAAAALLTALAAAAFALAPGPSAARTLLAGMAATAAAVAVLDLRWLVIPDLYVLAIATPGLAGPLAPGLAASVVGALLAAGLLWSVGALVGRRLGREALGLGDVKLAAALGCLLGPGDVLWAVFAASALGVLAALAIARHGTDGEAPRIPFGAILAPAGVAVLWMQHTP